MTGIAQGRPDVLSIRRLIIDGGADVCMYTGSGPRLTSAFGERRNAAPPAFAVKAR